MQCFYQCCGVPAFHIDFVFAWRGFVPAIIAVGFGIGDSGDAPFHMSEGTAGGTVIVGGREGQIIYRNGGFPTSPADDGRCCRSRHNGDDDGRCVAVDAADAARAWAVETNGSREPR